MIILYIFLLSLVGITFLEILNQIKVINIKKITISEYICVFLNLGFLTFSIYMHLIDVMNINLVFNILFIPLFINAFPALIIIYSRIKKKEFLKIEKYSFRSKFRRVLNLILNILLIIMIMAIVAVAFGNFMTFPDEFSYWGLQPKAFFINKTFAEFQPHYPNFMPSLTSGYYFFINKVSENGPRILQSIFLITNFVLLYNVCKRKKIDVFLFKVLSLVVIIFYPGIFDISISLYCDIAFMLFYSMGIIYLLEWSFYERNNNNFFLSILFTILCIWTKKDGMFLTIYMYLFIIAVKIFSAKLKIEKIKIFDIIKFIFFTAIIFVFWKIYLSVFVPVANSDGIKATSLHLSNFIPMIIAMKNQIFSSLSLTIGFVALLVSSILVIPKMELKEKAYNFSLLSFIFINVAFLAVCYVTVFGGEGLTAASFIRYMSRDIPIIVLFLLNVITFSKTNKN